MITGYNKAQVDKILNREDNKDILQECLKFETVRKFISQKDMESVVEHLNELYSAKKMAKIIPLLIMLFVSVDERVDAEKIIGNASFFMYAVPIYYMTINKISEIGEASVPRLKHCDVGELEVNYQSDDGKIKVKVRPGISYDRVKIGTKDSLRRRDSTVQNIIVTME